MAAVLPVVNQGDSDLVETLQKQVDESVVRENESLEILETQKDLLSDISETLSKVVDPLKRMVDFMKESEERAQRREDRLEHERIREDIARDQPDFDAVERGDIEERDKLFDFSNIDTGTISNILGMAVMAFIFDVDDVIRKAASAITMKLHSAAIALFRLPLTLFRGVRDFIVGLNVIRPIREMIQTVFRPFTNIFREIAGFIRPVVQSLGGVGRVLRTFLGPFTLLVFGIIDFIRGFVEGFKEGGVLEGLKGGLSELLANMVGIPLDMMRQFTAWVANKFGFEGVSEALREFSFRDLIRDTFEKLWNFLGDLFKNPVQTFKRLFIGGEEPETQIDEEEVERRVQKKAADQRERVARQSQMEEAARLGGLADLDIGVDPEAIRQGQAMRRATTEAAQKQQAQAPGATAVVNAPMSDNSQTTVQNNRSEFRVKPGPRSSDHTFKELQRQYLQ